MMPFIAFIIGILLPTLNGTLLLLLLERHHAVLARTERILLGCIVGITLSMYLVFLVHIITGAPLVFLTFLTVQIICSIILAFLCHRNRLLPLIQKGAKFDHHRLSKLFLAVAIILGGWVAVKTILVATVFLTIAPTYYDDSLDNWNMRGKIFYVDHALTLVLPNEDPITSPRGTSSYPPTVPLMKTWMATINGEWNESLINSIHVVWYIAALVLVYFAIRRHASKVWAMLGAYMLAGMPLYLMHGTNAYGDAFLSVHVFAAISMLFHAVHAKTPEMRLAFLRIGALCTALLPFTKNEGMLVYLPPLILILAITALYFHRRRMLSVTQIFQTVAWYVVTLALIAGPWLLFKWSHGLTFGNAKPFTSLGLGWQENVLQAMFINTFFEGNWLLLFPLLFALIIWKWRSAFTGLATLTGFFLIIYIGQGLLYLFTSLSTEALRQTGYARGLVQLMPTVILLTTLLLQTTCQRQRNDE